MKVKLNEPITKEEAKRIYHENHQRIVDDEATSCVSLRHINKIYPNRVQAVFDFNLEVEKHDFVALVGPSGCGKSTTLRMIAGLEDITDGHLYIEGVLANYLPSKDRDIAMVFQSYALYPQLNVYDNIAFGLRIRKLPKEEIEKRVFQASEILNLGQYLDRKPKELSGGQMQRVALGRAIVRDAKIFLMDEPLSNLDAKLRVQMRSEIVRIHEEVGATTIYVTHDQIEAMTMANKIVVMNRGFIQQIGSPMDIYTTPHNLFVATFIGTPPMNIWEVTYHDGELVIDANWHIKLPKEAIIRHEQYYRQKVAELDALLTDFEQLSLNDLATIWLKRMAQTNESEKGQELVKPHKNHFFNKIKALFSRHKEAKKDDREERAIYKQSLEELRDKYQMAIEQPHQLKMGFRPEFVHSSENTKGHPSPIFSVRCDMVEILGSEFVVYASGLGRKLTIKLQEAVVPHSEMDCVIDISGILLFDEDCGENIIVYDKKGENK